METISEEELAEEKYEIDRVYRFLKIGQVFRRTSLACFMKCNGKVNGYYNADPSTLFGKNAICYGD